MICYNNQLMKSTRQLQLFLVSNPKPFDNYEDHEAAIYLHLLALIEDAIKEKEDPIALIEVSLGVTYPSGDTADEIAAFLWQAGEMLTAKHLLRDHWHAYDPSLPANSLMQGGPSRSEAVAVFGQMTLRTYLEALVSSN